jgi:hypothetical protein
MKAKQPVRRVRRKATDRERLIQEQAASGLTKKAFCAQRQINLATFYTWAKRKQTCAVSCRDPYLLNHGKRHPTVPT